jgi:hypothetical protein
MFTSFTEVMAALDKSNCSGLGERSFLQLPTVRAKATKQKKRSFFFMI